MVKETSIPAGYKQTEVGVIPEDWGVVRLGDISKIKYGLGQPPQTKDDGVPMIRATNINSGKIFEKDVLMIDITKIPTTREVILKDGDIIVVRSGAYTGDVGLVTKKWDGCVAGYDLIVSSNRGKVKPQFLSNYLLSPQIQKCFMGLKTRSAQSHLNSNQLGYISVVLPTLTEQQAIASVLSDVDALITAQEQLITKKRNIKQGAMQQLLTGKKRLSGFIWGWEEKSLLELADNKKELFDDGDWIEAEYLTEYGIRLIQTGNIGMGIFLEKENKKYISSESFNNLKCKEIRQGDILICRLAEPAGRACIMPNIGESKMITAVDVSIFRPLQPIADRQYLVNIFSTGKWFNIINEKCGGSTRSRIARGELGKIKILLPPLPEQQAIATLLSDMDSEIEELEQERDKYRALKQGMMQELLTGKTRLV